MKNAFYRRHCESAPHGDFILMNLNGGRGNLPIWKRKDRCIGTNNDITIRGNDILFLNWYIQLQIKPGATSPDWEIATSRQVDSLYCNCRVGGTRNDDMNEHPPSAIR
jgi:hypothetical protein